MPTNPFRIGFLFSYTYTLFLYFLAKLIFEKTTRTTISIVYLQLPRYITLWKRANNPPNNNIRAKKILFTSNADAFINQELPASIDTGTDSLPPDLPDPNRSNADSSPPRWGGRTTTSIDDTCHGDYGSSQRRQVMAVAALIGVPLEGVLILFRGKSHCP